MFGTIKYSSRIQYGRNKRNLPYYLFEPFDYDSENKKVIVASKLKADRIDHYAEIELLDITTSPIKGGIKQIYGQVNDYECTKKLILYKNYILKKRNFTSEIEDYESDDKFNDFTYSIDPEGSKDIDDAFSYNFDKKILKVHITDLTELKISDFDELMNIGFTFYDKDGNINMLPSEISENVCSLLEDKVRRSISMIINLKTNEITFSKISIKVNKNLTYDEADNLFTINPKWIKFKNEIIPFIGDFNDSHIFIEKIMILYNTEFSKYLDNCYKIFPIRIHKGLKEDFENLDIEESLKKKICYHAAEYVPVNNEITLHKSLGIDKYTHASSPLRRFVDLLNQRIAFNNFNSNIENICDIINKREKSFKSAYRDIKLLDLCNQLKDSEERNYDAIIFGFEELKILVFIPDLDIIYNVLLFPYKISSVFEVISDDKQMKIEHIESKNVIYLEKFQKVKLTTMIKLYESKLYKKIRFFITEPYLVDLSEQ